jgi:hypothetical protein
MPLPWWAVLLLITASVALAILYAICRGEPDGDL